MPQEARRPTGKPGLTKERKATPAGGKIRRGPAGCRRKPDGRNRTGRAPNPAGKDRPARILCPPEPFPPCRRYPCKPLLQETAMKGIAAWLIGIPIPIIIILYLTDVF